MKSLVCEMCGGNNLVKQEGVFVCQNCKTKYSVEEARKMMIEGTVDVTGSTVKVDNTARLDNLYKSARRARDSGNSKQAFKYYEQLQMEDPDNWESAFYVAYYSAIYVLRNDSPGGSVQISGGQVSLSYAYRSGITPCIDAMSNCFDSVFSLIDGIQDYDEQKAAVDTVCGDVSTLASNLDDIIDTEHKRMDGEILKYAQNIEGGTVSVTIKAQGWYKKNAGNRDSYKQDVSNMRSLANRHRSRIKESAKERRNDEFWAENPQLKTELETEKQSLSMQLNTLNQEMAAIPGYSDLGNLNTLIQQLEAQKNALGLFKSKEKKAIQANIDYQKQQYNNVHARLSPAVTAVQNRIDSAQGRISEIDSKLARPLYDHGEAGDDERRKIEELGFDPDDEVDVEVARMLLDDD